jgi:hypothetical protein
MEMLFGGAACGEYYFIGSNDATNPSFICFADGCGEFATRRWESSGILMLWTSIVESSTDFLFSANLCLRFDRRCEVLQPGMIMFPSIYDRRALLLVRPSRLAVEIHLNYLK